MFPEIVQEHGEDKRLDIKCGFSKNFLTGKLNEHHTSQIWFNQGNKVSFTVNFGCGIFVGPQTIDSPMDFLKRLVSQGEKEDLSGKDWKMFRSFFVAVHGFTILDFQPSMFSSVFMQASIKDFDFDLREFHIYKQGLNGSPDVEMIKEEDKYSVFINGFKGMIKNTPITSFLSRFPLLQGIPTSPFPKYQKCLGITPTDGMFEIMDRYIHASFNIKAVAADE